MTNPISKAIVKAAVAMGYGKKSDYKGSSVADVLEKFAAIAKDKGGSSGGGVADIIGTIAENNTFVVNMTIDNLVDTMQQGARIAISYENEGHTMESFFYLTQIHTYQSITTIRVFCIFSSAPLIYEGTEQDGKTIFSVMQV